MKRSALDHLEQALQLLRGQSAQGWCYYLAGAVPFLLMVLTFDRDMRSDYSAQRSVLESLLCAMAFFWNSVWKARFSGTLAAVLSGEEQKREHNSFWQTLYVQSVLQTFKLVVLPLAVISVFPLAWTCAIFRYVNIEADHARVTLPSVIRKSATNATRSFPSAWFALVVLLAIGAVLFVNLFIAVVLLPQLTKAFTGYENEWTRNAGSVLSFNLFAVALALTWLLIDPVLQAYFVVRSFEMEARSSGRDLLMRVRRVAAVILVSAAIGASAHTASAAERTLSKDEVDRSVASVLTTDGDFQWQRLQDQGGTGNSFIDRIARDVRTAIHYVRGWVSKIAAVLSGLLPQRTTPMPQKPATPHPQAEVQWWMYAIGSIILLALIIAVFRTRSETEVLSKTDSMADAMPPDIESEQLLATDM
ncbi:MAG: hypothetical protein JOZ62_18440, partial [Acidobacteriaceae bacterium]|nr:hypothetical protein [Acidobacteriaceae bacterium]